MKIVQIIASFSLMIGGVLFLLAWYRERKHPNQKLLGFAFLGMGALRILAYVFGWME